MNIQTILFDMDGVVADTEEQYDEFLHSFIKEYDLPSDFMSKVKGVRWPEIIERYFSHLSKDQQEQILKEVFEFEATELIYNTIPGVVEFIKNVKKQNYKIGLVTSSLKPKTNIALKKMNLENIFDVVVTANDISRGKPSPDCYLLAAEKLKAEPSACIVFEDSFAGIEAGQKAGMKVIGVSTTNSKEALQGKVHTIIPDFNKVTIEEIIK